MSKLFYNTPLIYLSLLIALILRLGFIALFDNGSLLENNNINGDSVIYDGVATLILEGEGIYNRAMLEIYPFGSYFYPIFLAATYKLFGRNFVVVRFIQIVLSVITVLGIYLLGKETFNKNVGQISSLIAAFYPPFVYRVGDILTETLIVFFITFALFLLVKGFKSHSWVPFYGGICFLLLAALTRPSAALLFLLFIPFVWWKSTERWAKFGKILSLLLVFTLTILLLLLIPSRMNARGNERGTSSIDKFIYISLQIYNNKVKLDGGVEWKEFENWKQQHSQITSFDGQGATRFVIYHPIGYLKTLLVRAWTIWRPYLNPIVYGWKFQIIMILSDGPILLLFIFALAYKPLQEFTFPKFLFISIIFYYTIVHAFTFANVRYRLQFMPFVIILASYGLIQVFSHFIEQKSCQSLKD